VLDTVPNSFARVHEPVSIQLSAHDADLPPNHLTFTLLSGPLGATVGADSGLFQWAPKVSQAGTENHIVVQVTDDGLPPLSATTSFDVMVLESAGSLTLVPISDQVLDEGTLLSVTNSVISSGSVGAGVIYSLDSTAP